MGGIPGDVPGGAGRGPGQLGADGAAVGVPQESPRSEETDACENQWGEDQACCDGENIKSPRKVCKLTRLEGWHGAWHLSTSERRSWIASTVSLVRVREAGQGAASWVAGRGILSVMKSR